jgi:mannitol-1-phosphate 5-dehydrogenase
MAAGHKRPLNTITCENLVGAGRRLRDLVWQALRRQAAAGGPTPDELLRWHGHPAHDSRAGSPCHLRAAFDARFGFAEAVVSRMVPIVPEEVRRRDPLWIASEPYARLPVDGRAFRGPVPPIVGLEPVDPILAHQRRKLASHNMSHAVCAYLGHLAGHAFLWQAVSDAAIFADVRGAVDETGRALIRRFGFRPDEQRAYEDDLLGRYRNRALGDQVRRVAADPLRKLGPDDRLIGSASLCLEEGIEPVHVLKGVRAALRYDRADDPSAVRLQEMRRTRGLAAVLEAVCGLRPGGPLFERIIAADGAE